MAVNKPGSARADQTARARGSFLSTLTADRRDWCLALTLVLILSALFVATAPFARVPLPTVWAFIPVYQSAVIVNDLITAVMLFGQFSFLGSRALLALGCGFLFSAFMAMAHALSFPGLFAETGLLGAGPQTTAWLYFLWHAGFPLFLIAYARLKSAPEARRAPRQALAAIGLAIMAVLALASAITWFCTGGHDALPVIMQGNADASAKVFVAAGTWLLGLIALFVLWKQKPHTVLDLWCMVVACVWIFDTALAAVLNGARFDLGFYAGRVYGLMAASFVLMVLLLEHARLYAQLVSAHEGERRERQVVEEKSAELMIVNKELDAFSYSISHDLRSPLRAIGGFAAILTDEHSQRLDDEGRRLLGLIRRSANRMEQMIDELLHFSRLGRQPLKTQPVELHKLVAQSLEDLAPNLAGRNVELVVGEMGVAQIDATLFKHVLDNLLGNAVKYTRQRDQAVIAVGRIDTERPGEVETYFVRDNGVGFDMKQVDRLFGVFQRLHSAKEFEGTGVGLAIVQRVINRHGGRIWAESRPDKGAAFYFTLRPEPAAAAGPEHRQEQPSPAALSPRLQA